MWTEAHIGQERTSRVDGWSDSLTVVDPFLDVQDLDGRAKVTNACHPGHEQLLRADRHDVAFELRRVFLQPFEQVRMPCINQVNVGIPEARQDRHSFGRDARVPVGDLQRSDRPDSFNALTANQDHAVADKGHFLSTPATDPPGCTGLFSGIVPQAVVVPTVKSKSPRRMHIGRRRCMLGWHSARPESGGRRSLQPSLRSISTRRGLSTLAKVAAPRSGKVDSRKAISTSCASFAR